MILHFGSIYTIRNGILMTKYVIYHSEEFDHPYSAFLLGVMVVCVNIFCEITNLLYSLTQKDVTGVISKFVAFKILIQVQDYYNRSRANFRIRNAVNSYPLVIVTDIDKVLGLAKKSKSRNKDKDGVDPNIHSFLEDLDGLSSSMHKRRTKQNKNKRAMMIIMYYVYKLLRTFYTTIYFYFFPLGVVMIPFWYTL